MSALFEQLEATVTEVGERYVLVRIVGTELRLTIPIPAKRRAYWEGQVGELVTLDLVANHDEEPADDEDEDDRGDALSPL